ncbi:MAG TPA: EamA/RhaT family transporter [Chloroflexi bacterium]|nr:EamA/RhaT family transporter [Chloroflexota bacterium]
MSTQQTATHPPLTRGYLFALAGTAFWSSTGVLIRYLSTAHALPSLVLAFWRDLFAATTLALGFLILGRRRALWSTCRRHLSFLVAYGFVLATFNALWTASVALNGAAVGTVLAYSAPAFTALAGRRLFGERVGPLKIIALILSITGCVAVSGAYDPAAWAVAPLGIVIGLLSGLGFSAYSLMGKASSRRKLEAWSVTFWGFAFAAVFLLLFQAPLGQIDDLFWLGTSLHGWSVLLLLAIAPTIGGYGMYTASMRYLPAGTANLISTLEPPLTVLIAYLLLQERMTGVQVVGSLLIVAGVVLVRSRG